VYSIGDLARLGGVTPRMLRHYDELGVFVPDHVDPDTGYRRYGPTQLADLFRVLALKDLGFALTDVRRIVAGEIGPSELRGMLLLRRTEIETELAESTTRLGRVEQQIERLERQMNQPPTTVDVTTKALPALHLAVASDVSPSYASADIGPTIQPLYPLLFAALEAAGVTPTGPSVAYYEDLGDDGVGVHAGFPVHPSITEVDDLEVVDLPAVELAATAIHEGDMASCDVATVPVLFDWIGEHGYAATGRSREIYLHCPDDLAAWRTEMQFPIERCE
jgi:DNA-binding transcriptional MerR regulator